MRAFLSIFKHARSRLNFNRVKFNPKENLDSCIILGNGPSLTKQLESIKSVWGSANFIAVNSFASSDFYLKIKPSLYVLLCPAYLAALERHTETTGSSTERQTLDILSNQKVSTWRMHVFVPMLWMNNEKIISLLRRNNNITICTYNTNMTEYPRIINHYLYKKNFSMPRAQNVLIVAIYISILCGFKKMLLFGVDHSWHKDIYVDAKNDLYVSYKHFYGENKVKFYTFSGSKEIFRMSTLFQALWQTFSSYDELSVFSKYMDKEIINCTENSYIDSFKKDIVPS
jgi:hypothetical protein